MLSILQVVIAAKMHLTIKCLLHLILICIRTCLHSFNKKTQQNKKQSIAEMPWHCAVTAWLFCNRTGHVLRSSVKGTWLLSTLANLSSSSLAYAVLKTCWTFSEIVSIATNTTVPMISFFVVLLRAAETRRVKVTLQSNCGASNTICLCSEVWWSFSPHVHVPWLALIIRIWHFSLNCVCWFWLG